MIKYFPRTGRSTQNAIGTNIYLFLLFYCCKRTILQVISYESVPALLNVISLTTSIQTWRLNTQESFFVNLFFVVWRMSTRTIDIPIGPHSIISLVCHPLLPSRGNSSLLFSWCHNDIRRSMEWNFFNGQSHGYLLRNGRWNGSTGEYFILMSDNVHLSKIFCCSSFLTWHLVRIWSVPRELSPILPLLPCSSK